MFTKAIWDKSFIFNDIRLRREWLQLGKGLWWQVGDTVACQPNDKQGLFAQWELDCRRVLFGD
jgi:hypothetical protein